jgi:hypothetical protein
MYSGDQPKQPLDRKGFFVAVKKGLNLPVRQSKGFREAQKAA